MDIVKRQRSENGHENKGNLKCASFTPSFCKLMLNQIVAKAECNGSWLKQLIKLAEVKTGRCTAFHVVALVVLGEKVSRCNRKIGFVPEAASGAVISSWVFMNVSSSLPCPTTVALSVRFFLDQRSALFQRCRSQRRGAIWAPSAESPFLWVK